MLRDSRSIAIVALSLAVLLFTGAVVFAVASQRSMPPTPTVSGRQAATPVRGTPTRATPVVAIAETATPEEADETPEVEEEPTATPTAPATPTLPRVAATPTTVAVAPVATATVPVQLPTPTPTRSTAPAATATRPPATQAPTPTPTPAVAAAGITPLLTNGLQYGFNVFLAGNAAGASDNAFAMGKVRESGFGWIRIQLQWREFEPSPGAYNPLPYDIMIGTAAKSGTNVLVSVVKAPDWASPSRPGALPEDTPAFERTMRFLADRYRGRVQAWEIWNEQNLAGEVGGHVQVAPYYETLKAGYEGVKATDPDAFVLFGGLTPTGLNDPSIAIDDIDYLRAFYEYAGGDGRNYFDALAAHPGSAANPPDTSFPDKPGPGHCPPKFAAQEGSCWRNAPDFYFRRIEDQRAVMEEYGDSGKQVWLTEFGWDSCQGLPAPNGYEYCALTSEAQQAEYLVRAVEIAREEWPWLGAMFVWNLNYAATPSIGPTDEKFGWSLLRADGSNRPAFIALRDLPK
ncbi:MAG: cellulase family glycosylhydrolase [Chloroflexia bacterium]